VSNPGIKFGSTSDSRRSIAEATVLKANRAASTGSQPDFAMELPSSY